MSSNDASPKTPAERHVLDVLAGAAPIDFQDVAASDQRTLRGEWLRALFLLPDLIPFSGLHLRHARIEGGLNLRDFNRPTPSGLPAVSLEHCEFVGDVDLCFARIARLSLAGSSFRKLSVREAEIDGPLDISGVHPLREDGEQGTCWIDARDCLINGELNAAGASLRLRKPGPNRPSDTEIHYALWLRNAAVHGSVHLVNDFVALGGVSIEAAHIRGNVTARGALVAACEDDAFNAQNARVGGGLLLDRPREGAERVPFRAHGTVWLLGIRIGATLQLDGAVLNAAECPHWASWKRPAEALNGSNMDVGTNLRMIEARINGPVVLSGTRVGGRVDCSDTNIACEPGENLGFFALGLSVAGQVKFERTRVRGGIDLTGATIGGGLSCDGATLEHGKPNGGLALCAQNATIGQDLKFGRSNAFDKDVDKVLGFFASGLIDLTGATIAGQLRFDGAILNNELEPDSEDPDRRGQAFKATRVEVKGRLDLDNTSVVGEINLSAASIGGNLNCRGSFFDQTTRSAIYAKDLRVGGDFRLLDQTTISGDLNLQRADIVGKLHWQDLTVVAADNGGESVKIDLKHSRIGAVLEAELLRLQGAVRIDLGSANISTLESSWPDGWGIPDDAPIQHRCPVNLDGLAYERIMVTPGRSQADTGDVADRESWRSKALIGWLKRQDRGLSGLDFTPQPYRQLARVLRIQGDEDAARLISIAERDEQSGHLPYLERTLLRYLRPWWNAVSRWARRYLRAGYGLFFGYGLKPARAFATVFAYALIGTAGVYFAKAEQVLIERPLPVATMAWTDQAQPTIVAGPTAGILTSPPRIDVVAEPMQGFRRVPLGRHSAELATELACTDAANNLWDDMVYAVDMILPFIPLHEEAKCEIIADNERNHPVWRALREVYTIVGWLVSSLALLTVSGFVRRSEDAGLE